MPVDPLESAWHKFHWASKHMDSVDKALKRSFDSNRNTVPVETQIQSSGNGATAIVRIKSLPTVRNDCGLALGDVLQNFRASLDHVAWGLVSVGHEPRPAKPRRVYFPMAESWGSFQGQIDDWLPGVPDEFRTLIRRYQPYRRGDGPKAIRWLRNLSDRDKHQVLIPASVNSNFVNLQVTSNWTFASSEYLVRRPRALKVGTPLLRAEFIRSGDDECDVKVDGGMAIYPSLGRGVPLRNALALIRETVLEIISEIDRML